MKNYNSLADALNDLKSRGYQASFESGSYGLYCGDLDMRLDPDEFKVDEEYRFDAEPNDVAVVVAITTVSGVKGILVDGYASHDVSRLP